MFNSIVKRCLRPSRLSGSLSRSTTLPSPPKGQTNPLSPPFSRSRVSACSTSRCCEQLDRAVLDPEETKSASSSSPCRRTVPDIVYKHAGASGCDMSFCPPDKAQNCRLARYPNIPLPRGEDGLMKQKDIGVLKRSLKCPRAYRGLLVDAAGTLIDSSQSTQEVYHEIGRKYGITFSEEEIAKKYKAAYGHPWCRYRMRYEDDGKRFWQKIIQESTGCDDPALLEDLYDYYTTDKAWHIRDPNAEKALKAIRDSGLKIAVVSNFDTRLRPLMRVLRCYDWFDTIIVSAEVGVEKPNPDIFFMACNELGVEPSQVLHVGDDKTNDIVGATAAGVDSLLWGEEVSSFAEVAKKLGIAV